MVTTRTINRCLKVITFINAIIRLCLVENGELIILLIQEQYWSDVFVFPLELACLASAQTQGRAGVLYCIMQYHAYKSFNTMPKLACLPFNAALSNIHDGHL